MPKDKRPQKNDNGDQIDARLVRTLDIDIQEKFTIPINRLEEFMKDRTKFKMRWSG